MGRIGSNVGAHKMARQSSLAMRSDQSSPYSLRSGASPAAQTNYNQQAFNQMYQPPQVCCAVPFSAVLCAVLYRISR